MSQRYSAVHQMSKRNHSGVIQLKQNMNLDRDVLDEAPKDINVVQFAESRAAEIQALQKHVSAPGGNQLVFQTLPTHMRRRAMSHNIKRLPRRIREMAKKEYEKRDKTAKSKRPSRKHRRRARNLLADYTRRQRNNVWLETHIWHAKRFFMGNKWGYRIPLHPTDKSLRASYRAVKNHCTMQDISYMCCIELTGHQEQILEGLAHMTSPETGPTFAARACLSGTREGKAMLYACDKYPYNFIGCATYLWQPLLNDVELESEKKLWIWVHPSCYEEFWIQLKVAFKCSIDPTDKDKNEVIAMETKDDATTVIEISDDENSLNDGQSKQKKFKTGDVKEKDCVEVEDSSSEKVVCINRKFETKNVKVESLKDCLVRFRLTGPESHAVLGGAMEVADILCSRKDAEYWWNKYYSNEIATLGYSQQREFWEKVVKCRSPAELRPHCVLGLTIQDPRVRIPDKRIKATDSRQELDSDTVMDIITADMSASALWDPEIRSEVKNSKMTDNHLNQLKTDNLLPGTRLQLGADESKVPVLLVQNPGVQQTACNKKNPPTNYGSGWDIILPAGWSMAFWVALIYQGARAGGLREFENLSVEQGSLHFPSDYFDSEAGKKAEQDKFKELSDTYYRKPPAKRPNFIKCGIKLPFQFPWQQLIEEWNKEDNQEQFTGNFYILRNRCDLCSLSKPFYNETVLQLRNKEKYELCVRDDNPVGKLMFCDESTLSVIGRHRNSLVAVQIKMVTRGAPEEYANICIPSKDDLLTLIKNFSWNGPTEQVHPDNTKTKKDRNKTSVHGKTEEVSQRNFIPTACDNLIRSCSRPVIGYLKQGGMSLSVGQGRGIGYCAIAGMRELLRIIPNKMPCVVLIRNPNSFQYRCAYLQVLL